MWIQQLVLPDKCLAVRVKKTTLYSSSLLVSFASCAFSICFNVFNFVPHHFSLYFFFFFPLCSCHMFLLVCPSLSPVIFSSIFPSLCLTQTSRRSSHRREWSTIGEQYHALERCYFWVSHDLNQTPPTSLFYSTVIVMLIVSLLSSHPFASFKYF